MGSIQTTFKFAPRLLNHLGISAYNSVRKCIAELVANSYDADAEKVSIQLPDIIDENALIEIEDNGTGMSPEEIENNLWLVREGLELWSSDKPLKTLLETRLDQLYKDQNDLRPDLVCRSRNDGNEAVILEFKRPKETIKMTHVTQAMEYAGLLKKHRPSISFETFVVGREYHSDVLATKENLEKASLFLWSYEEILQRARMRFEQILEILGQ